MPKITFNRWPKTETEFKRLMMTVKAHCRLRIDMPNKCKGDDLEVSQRDQDPADIQWQPQTWTPMETKND